MHTILLLRPVFLDAFVLGSYASTTVVVHALCSLTLIWVCWKKMDFQSSYLSVIRRTARDEYSVWQDARLWELRHTSANSMRSMTISPAVRTSLEKVSKLIDLPNVSAHLPPPPKLPLWVTVWYVGQITPWIHPVLCALSGRRCMFTARSLGGGPKQREKSITSACSRTAQVNTQEKSAAQTTSRRTNRLHSWAADFPLKVFRKWYRPALLWLHQYLEYMHGT